MATICWFSSGCSDSYVVMFMAGFFSNKSPSCAKMGKRFAPQLAHNRAIGRQEVAAIPLFLLKICTENPCWTSTGRQFIDCLSFWPLVGSLMDCNLVSLHLCRILTLIWHCWHTMHTWLQTLKRLLNDAWILAIWNSKPSRQFVSFCNRNFTKAKKQTN